MSDYRVDSVYDIASIEEEQAKFLAFLAESKRAVLDLNNQRIGLKESGISSFAQASQNLNKTIADSNTAIQKVTNTSVEYNKQLALSSRAAKEAAQAKLIEAKAILEQEKADAVRTKSLIVQEKELERLIALEEKKNAAVAASVVDGGSRNSSQAIQATEAQIQAAERLRDAEAQAAMSATEYGNSVNKSTGGVKIAMQADLELEKARKAVAKANSTQNVELQGLNAQRSLANKAAKEEALTALGLLGPYKLLEKEYAAAAMNAKDLSVQYGINSVEAKAAAAEALALNTQLQTIDKTVGQSQKNVGNYPSAFDKLGKGLSTAYSGLRKIAYIIPGLGIAGLISLIAGPVVDAFESWIASMKKADDTEKILKDTIAATGTEYERAVVNVTTLKDEIQLAKEGFLDKDKVVKHYNETIGKTAGFVKDLDEAEQSLVKNGQAYVQMTLYKAAANIALEGAAKKAFEAAQISRQKDEDFEKAIDRSNNFNIRSEADAKRATEQIKANEKERKDAKVKSALDAQNQLLQIGKDFNAAAAQIAKGFGFNLFGDNQEDKSKKGKKPKQDNLQELKDRQNTEFQIYKIAQEAKINLLDKGTKDENIYYLDKLSNLDEYIKAEKELLDKEEQNEIDLANKAAAREIQHLQESKVGKSKPEKARIDQNIAITQKNLEQQILLIKAKYADLGVQVVEKAADERQKIIDKHLKDEEDSWKQYSDDLQKNIDADDARIKKGFEDKAKAEEEAAKKKIELLKQLHEQEEQLAVEAGNFLYNLATSGYERQLNLITEQSKQITKTKDEQLAANDAIVQSAQDKAANVVLINARAQAQQDVLDRKAADIKNKEAKFERAQQIFDIGIQTIKTLAQIKLQASVLASNPLTAALAPLALAQIPIALATSALSIGAILAKPLPKYKHGRGEKGEEFAIVGDGGVNEFIMRGNGSIEKTPAVNTLTHLMPKDKVYPNKEALMKELMLNNMQLSTYSVSKDGGINKNDIDRLGSRIENSISDIRIQTQLVTKSGWRNHNERLAKYDEWVNRVIKN